jgi:hypothetical protein
VFSVIYAALVDPYIHPCADRCTANFESKRRFCWQGRHCWSGVWNRVRDFRAISGTGGPDGIAIRVRASQQLNLRRIAHHKEN